MLTLSGRPLSSTWEEGVPPALFPLSVTRNVPSVLRPGRAWLITGEEIPTGYSHYLVLAKEQGLARGIPTAVPRTILPDSFDYLGDEDILRLGAKEIRVLFRAKSPHNSILLTEQCNHYCLMCSQPPKRRNDRWIVDEVRRLIQLIPKGTLQLGFTGGEPTLLGDDLIGILSLTRAMLPDTAVHLLSNGRGFADPAFTDRYAAIQHHDLMVGIPLYSDHPALHDYVVQARGAFDETLRGILNLKRLRQRVEIRVVLHRHTVERLPKLAEFLTRNLLFADQVVLMGLEMTGFTLANREELWVDPVAYRDHLREAVSILRDFGIRTSVYNLPHCAIHQEVEEVYVKSISDWKNEFPKACDGCTRRGECGGFFSGNMRQGQFGTLQPFC